MRCVHAYTVYEYAKWLLTKRNLNMYPLSYLKLKIYPLSASHMYIFMQGQSPVGQEGNGGQTNQMWADFDDFITMYEYHRF